MRSLYFIYFIFLKEVTLSGVYCYEWGVWGRAVTHSLLTSQGCIRACLGPGTFPYLEPSPPVLSILPYLWISFPVLGLMCISLFCFKCVHMAPGQPHCCVCSWWGEKGVLCLYHRRGVCRPVSAVGQGALAMGHPHSLSRLILLCLFSECCSIQCLWESCFSQQPMQPCNPCTMRPANHAKHITMQLANHATHTTMQPAAHATMQPANHATCKPCSGLTFWDSFPGGSNRCHLLNKRPNCIWRRKRPDVKPIRLMSSLQELKIKIQ